MLIQANRPNPILTRPLQKDAVVAKEAPVGELPQDSRDTVALSELKAKPVQAMPEELPQSEPPPLPRPVIFVHGFNGSAERWGKLTEWLTSGETPVNRDGGILDAGQTEEIDGQANLFSLRFSRPYNSVETNARELKQTIEAVRNATGADEVDLVVHSLGGLGARHYLRDPDEKVAHVVIMGTPNRGSMLANLERFFRQNFNFPIKPPVDDSEVRRVLDQLAVDSDDRNGQPNNPWLRQLNNEWDEQRAKADFLILTGNGFPTLTQGPGLTIKADGVVTRNSAEMEGAESKRIWWRTHSAIQNSRQAMETTAKFLAGQELPEEDDLFDSPEDAKRAERALNPAPLTPPTPGPNPDLQQAARLPILDPAFQLGLGMGVLAAMMGGPKENLPLVEIDVNSQNSSTAIEAQYRVDLSNAEQPIVGFGTVGQEPLAEVATFEEGRILWQGQVGEQSAGLSLQVGEDERSIRMAGSLAGVDADLNLAPVQDEEGHFRGVRTEGILNGQPYKVETSVEMPSVFQGGQGRMTVRGTMDGGAVLKDYHLAVHRGPNGFSVSAEGGGVNAGTPQAVGVRVRVIDRDQ